MSPDFVQKTVDAFSKIREEIDEKGGELDFRHSLATCFLRDVLGWTRKKGEGCYRTREKEDLMLLDDSGSCVAIIETKNPKIKLRKTHREELKGHLDDTRTAKYGALTNGRLFQLFEYSAEGGLSELATINISSAVKRGAESLSKSERQDVYLLRRLLRDRFVRVKPEYFVETAQKVPVEKKFDLFIGNLRESLDDLTRIISRFFRFYQKSGPKHYGGKFLREDAFSKWRGASTGKEEELQEKFCKETAYVFLNRILFTRILEDKDIVPRLISGKGLADSLRLYGESAYEGALRQAYKNVEKFYEHFYEFGIFDWWHLPEDRREMSAADEEVQEELESELHGVVVRNILKRLNQFNFREVGRDILGDVYQEYLPPAERKRLGEFYTPIEVVRYILDATGYTPENKLEEKLLLDPACGSGTFLVEATSRLIDMHDKKGARLRDPDDCKRVLDNIINNIHGLDINPFACHIAEMNLLFTVIDLLNAVQRKYKSYKLDRFKVCQTDSLLPPGEEPVTVEEFVNGRIKSWTEEAKRANQVKKKQFDFVVGNPPYVRQEEFKKHKQTLEKTYPEVFNRRADLCVYFIAVATKWLKQKGRFGYIVSGKFTKTGYGRYIRAYIPMNTCVQQLIDLRGSKVFKEATNDPIILTFEKKHGEENRFAYVRAVEDMPGKTAEERIRKMLNHIENHVRKEYGDDYIQSYGVTQAQLLEGIKKEEMPLARYAASEWILTPAVSKDTYDKIGKIGEMDHLLEDVCDIRYGIRPGHTSAFRVGPEQIRRFKLEQKLLKPLLEGKNVRRYEIDYKDLFVIYTTRNVSIAEYPNAKEFLLNFRDELENRRQYQQRKEEGEDIRWYEIEQPDSPEIFETEKIIAPDISKKNNFAYDVGKYYCLDTVFVMVPKEKYKQHSKYFLGLLNSNVLEFFIKQKAAYLGRRGYRYKKRYLKQLPIKLPQTSKEKEIVTQVTGEVERILQLNGQLSKLKKKIENFPETYAPKTTKKLSEAAEDYKNLNKDKYKVSSPKIEKSGKGLHKLTLEKDNYITLASRELAEYVLEWLKRRKRVRRRELLGLEVPSVEEAARVMKEFFGDRERVEELKGQVEGLEGEINELVYELYGLDAKDRKVIEEFLERF